MSIEIEEIENGGSVTVVAKGHHDFEAFKAAYADYSGASAEEIEEPRHAFMRKTPPPAGYLAWWSECEKGRGAFPVTISGPM